MLANPAVLVYGSLFVPTACSVFGYAGQGVGKEFGHGSLLFLPAPEDEVLAGTGKGHVQQIQIVHPQLKTFVQIVLPVYGFRHGGGIVHRH